MFESFDFQQMISAFIVLFAVIDIIGSIPIIINLKEKGKDVNAMKATVISFLLMIGFFYAGDVLLRLFHVDIESFAVAGSFVIFLLSLEMILDIEIFKNQGPSNSKAAESDEIKKVAAIQAIIAQSQYGTLQRVGNSYWDACKKFANTVLSGNNGGLSDQEVMDTLVNEITASAVK